MREMIQIYSQCSITYFTRATVGWDLDLPMGTRIAVIYLLHTKKKKKQKGSTEVQTD